MATSNRKASSMLGALAESTGVAAYVVDPVNLIVLDANAGACRRSGLPREALVGQGIASLFTGFDSKLLRRSSPAPWRIQALCLGNGDPRPVELLVEHLDACVLIWQEERAVPKETETHFHGLLESAPDAMIVTDQNGVIVMTNGMTENLFGYARNELIGQAVEILIPDRLRSAHIKDRQRFARSPAPRAMGSRDIELVGRHKDGSEFYVEVSLSPMKTEARLLMVCAVRDITERKHFEQALEQQAIRLSRSNAELEQFAYVASHDLQEPLRMVASYVQLLARRYQGKLDSDADEFIGYAVDGARRMKALINDLLDYSRITRIDRPFRAVDCERVLGDVLQGLQPLIEDSRARVTHDPLPTLIADKAQLGQLFQNCISNALKFSDRDEPTVHVSAAKQNHEWILSFHDEGIGIDPQYFERIFAVFQRLHTYEKYPGTGIGLAICKKIVEHHNGRAWVESKPKHGSTFYFAFPAEQRE